MNARKAALAGVLFGVVAAALLVMAPLDVLAQAKGGKKSGKPGESVGRQVTMKGRVVCLHTFMVGEEVTPEKVKAIADAIRNGAPAALETSTGLIVLGQGTTNPGRFIFPHALRNVEVKGRVHDKGGLKYLDFVEVKQVQQDQNEEEEAGDEEEEEEEGD